MSFVCVCVLASCDILYNLRFKLHHVFVKQICGSQSQTSWEPLIYGIDMPFNYYSHYYYYYRCCCSFCCFHPAPFFCLCWKFINVGSLKFYMKSKCYQFLRFLHKDAHAQLFVIYYWFNKDKTWWDYFYQYIIELSSAMKKKKILQIKNILIRDSNFTVKLSHQWYVHIRTKHLISINHFNSNSCLLLQK